MPVIKRKTKKAITKQVRKIVKKHGPEIALGLASALVSSVVTKATASGDGKKKKRAGKGKKKSEGKAQSKAKAKGAAKAADGAKAKGGDKPKDGAKDNS
jgi:hypothetical protein